MNALQKLMPAAVKVGDLELRGLTLREFTDIMDKHPGLLGALAGESENENAPRRDVGILPAAALAIAVGGIVGMDRSEVEDAFKDLPAKVQNQIVNAVLDATLPEPDNVGTFLAGAMQLLRQNEKRSRTQGLDGLSDILNRQLSTASSQS
jgi:hypothetical protein